jgi:hypothetical protein
MPDLRASTTNIGSAGKRDIRCNKGLSEPEARGIEVLAGFGEVIPLLAGKSINFALDNQAGRQSTSLALANDSTVKYRVEMGVLDDTAV